MIIHEIDENNFNEYIKEGVVLVDFFATWCGPCKMIAPELEELAKTGQKVIKVDVDKYQMLSQKFGIMSVPTLMVFKDGKFLGNRAGYMTKDILVSWIADLSK